MLSAIEHWIDQLLQHHKEQRISCLSLPESIKQYFPDNFLHNAYYVETAHIPKPHIAKDIPGAEAFLAMQAQGITYKNTYFLLPGSAESTHLHELVHVAQWALLGAQQFMATYIAGVQTYGYEDSPLEMMAYGMQHEFERNNPVFDLPTRVEEELKHLSI